MIWFLETGILLVVAVVLRRALHMGKGSAASLGIPRNRKRNSSPLYTRLASEIEAHITILGVLLNDAIQEQNSGHSKIARRILGLFGSEWSRLVELIVNLQTLSLKYLPVVQSPISQRNLNAHAFRSQPMSEFFRRHGVLDQFVFRSKLRFQLHLQLLQGATAALTEDFDVARRGAGGDGRLLTWTLAQLDLYFHDLDLLSKETLLGFNAELASLPDSTLEEIEVEVSALTRNSVRESIPAPVPH